jgi:parvulin-like peptidyl-prolyl isomerase
MIPPPELTPAPVAPAPAPAAPPASDPEVKRVVDNITAIKLLPDPPKELPFATLRAAAVGDEVITIEELNVVVSQRMEEMSGAGPMSDQEKRQVVNMIASQALDHMIDQAVILQEAHRRMKNSKAQVMFNEFVDKTWREEELPPLLRKTTSANEYELKRKLTEEGKSYEGMKEAFRKKMLARDFLGSEIRNKVTCDLAEQRAYYNEHLKDFEQPARFTWREIEISLAKNPNRAEARAKADSVLARLLRDEDFGEVARAVSDGPTATKGGLYPDMTPGSYGIPVVNDELNRLPIGQISTVLEAPSAFHIVRVESRREAGPLRFDEVQDKIKPKVMERNYQKAIENYLNRLRSKTLIRTMFDNSESDPRLARRNDPSVRPASNR